MLLELLSFALINPDTDKIAVVIEREEKPAVERVQPMNDNYVRNIYTMKNNNFSKYYTENQEYAKTVLRDFNSRKDQEEQYLKWVSLPSEQLNGHFQSIYFQANKLKDRKGKVTRPLVVLGIGGSKHTAEFLLNMAGKGNQGLVYFYSDIDPISYENFIKSTKTGVENLNFLVVSKSGTTFETQDAFKRFEKDLIKYYQSTGLTYRQAKTAAQKHFAICTNRTPSNGNLREKIQDNDNYIKNLYIHDGVGGRYSMFDDAGLFVLSYAGVPFEYTERILKAANKVSIDSTDMHRINNNVAMQNAMFNVYAREKGHKIIYQQYFGSMFENAGENWAKQLYLESLKDFDFVVSKAPDSMHYAAEGLYNPSNRKKYYAVMTTFDPSISFNYQKYVSAIKDTYNEQNHVVVENLKTNGNALTPEAIGEYVQTKHFETVFMGCLRRTVNKKHPATYIQYPEVFQYNVELYKNKFKGEKAAYPVNAGE